MNSHWQWILYEICDIFFYLPSSRWSSSLSLEDTLSGRIHLISKWFRWTWQDWCRLMAFDEGKMIGEEMRNFLIDLHFDKLFNKVQEGIDTKFKNSHILNKLPARKVNQLRETRSWKKNMFVIIDTHIGSNHTANIHWDSSVSEGEFYEKNKISINY